MQSAFHQVTLADLEQATQLLLEELLPALEGAGYSQTSRFAIRLALEETLTNAFQHGNQGDPRKKVSLKWAFDDQGANFDVIDEGDGFDPAAVPDPTVEENLEIPAGRGLILVRSFMTELQVIAPGNHIKMRYVLPTGQEPG
jgi:serine/threonine-protein kinase RsbW